MECLVALFILTIIVVFTLPALGNISNLRNRQKNYLEFTNYSKTVTEKIISELSTNREISIREDEKYAVDYDISSEGDFRKVKVRITDRESESGASEGNSIRGCLYADPLLSCQPAGRLRMGGSAGGEL